MQSVLKLLIEKVDGKNPGVMIPIPQYPLYSASLAEFSIDQVHAAQYYRITLLAFISVLFSKH